MGAVTSKNNLMSGFRILGIVLAILGIAASVVPTWFGPLMGGTEPPTDVFEAIERRVRGGMVLELGLMFVAITSFALGPRAFPW